MKATVNQVSYLLSSDPVGETDPTGDDWEDDDEEPPPGGEDGKPDPPSS